MGDALSVPFIVSWAEHQDCPVFTVFLTIKTSSPAKGKIGNGLVVDIRYIDPEKPHPASLILSMIVPITPGFVLHWSENKTRTAPLFFIPGDLQVGTKNERRNISPHY